LVGVPLALKFTGLMRLVSPNISTFLMPSPSLLKVWLKLAPSRTLSKVLPVIVYADTDPVIASAAMPEKTNFILVLIHFTSFHFTS